MALLRGEIGDVATISAPITAHSGLVVFTYGDGPDGLVPAPGYWVVDIVSYPEHPVLGMVRVTVPGNYPYPETTGAIFYVSCFTGDPATSFHGNFAITGPKKGRRCPCEGSCP